MRTPSRFIRLWSVWLAVLALGVAATNYLVNPYDVFDLPRIAGLNRLKPAPKTHPMMAKAYQIGRFRPATVIIGSSVAYLGIDAGTPPWPAALQPVYNYGIPGSGLGTTLLTLRDALSIGTVRTAVVFLDFQNFFRPEGPIDETREDARRLHAMPDGRPNGARAAQLWRDRFLSLLSMGALADSARTVVGQHEAVTLDLAADGTATEADFIRAARADGLHDVFAQKDAYELDRARGFRPLAGERPGPTANMDVVRRLIGMAAESHVRLILAIAPHHADALELYWRLGLWPEIERMKSDLAGVAGQAGPDVTLWDFMEYGPFASDRVPPAGDRVTDTRWFWEPTHFRKALGALMVRRMFGAGDAGPGSVLTPANVAEVNARIRARRQQLICEQALPVLTALPDPPPDRCGRMAAAQAAGPGR